MAAKKDSYYPLVLKTPDGWQGTVSDQNELFTYILIRYLWLRVSHTHLGAVTLERWREYAPKYMHMYWASMVRLYKECLDVLGKTLFTHFASYAPLMAIYDWDALYTVAVMQKRFCDEPQNRSENRGITLEYQWDDRFGVAIMRILPRDNEIRKHVLSCRGNRYAGVEELLNCVFILDTPDDM